MERIKKRTKQQIIEDLARAASSVKLVCGVANNATWLVMMDAHDSIKKHPNYRGKVKYLYKQAFKEFKNNERQLLYANENRMFHLADMTPETRKKYGNITDAQYFEYWQGLGSKAYTEGHKWLTSLANKYRLSLVKHKVNNAESLSWVMVAQVCLELASHMYESALNACVKDFELPMSIMRDIFKYFSLRKVADIWKNALTMTAPDTQNYELDEVEDKNIAQGIMQLEMEWSDPKMIYGSAFTATQDFDDIFRTKGENKKQLREIQEVLAMTEELQENDRKRKIQDEIQNMKETG